MYRVLIQQLHGSKVDVLDVLGDLVGLRHHVGGEDGSSIMAPFPEHCRGDAVIRKRRRRGLGVHIDVQGGQRGLVPAVTARLHLGFPLDHPFEHFGLGASLQSSGSWNWVRLLQEKQLKTFPCEGKIVNSLPHRRAF